MAELRERIEEHLTIGEALTTYVDQAEYMRLRCEQSALPTRSRLESPPLDT